MPATDLGGDPVGLLGARPEDLQPDRRRSRRDALWPEALDDPGPDLEPVRVVEPDEPVGGVQDRCQRTVVPPQDDGPCPEVAILECEDVVHRGAPERVDRLVVVADHGHVPMVVRERRDQFGLGSVRVLELVDEDVPEPARDLESCRGRGPDQPQRERDLVAEIDAARGSHQLLVGRVRPRQLGLPPRVLGRRLDGILGRRVVRCGGVADARRLRCHTIRVGQVIRRRDVLVLAAAEQRRERRQEARRVAERPVSVELEFEQVLAQEDDDLRPGQDAQIRRQAEFEGVLADDPVAERMERADRGVRVAIRDELVDADRHLLGRLVREGQGEDLGRLRPTGRDEPGDAARDDLGLAGACAGHHEERPGAVGHGAELVRIESAEQRLETRRRLGRGRRRHDRARARSRPAAGRVATARDAGGRAVGSR